MKADVTTSSLLRAAKILIAVILIGISLWALLLPPYFPTSSNAVVNTRKISVNSRTDGVVRELDVTPRCEVSKGQVIARVERDQSSLQRQLQELKFLKKRLQTQLANTEVGLEFRKKSLAKAKADYAIRKNKTIASLQDQLVDLQQKVVLEKKQLELFNESQQRVQTLLDKGIVTRAKWLELNKLGLESEKRLQSSQSDVKRVADQLDMVRSGMAPSNDEGSDAMTTEIATMQHEIRDLQTEKSDLELQLSETNSQIATNQNYQKSTRDLSITSPGDGMVWNCKSVVGENVSTGQSIAQLADRHSIFVDSFFQRYYLGNISPGDHAFVQLRGQKRLLTGRVYEVRVQENGSNNLYTIDQIAPNNTMLRVFIKLDDNHLPMTRIGESCKVVITSGKPGFINRTLVRLSLLLRNHQ